MQDIEPGSSHTSNVLRGLLGEIETLRFRRQEDITASEQTCQNFPTAPDQATASLPFGR